MYAEAQAADRLRSLLEGVAIDIIPVADRDEALLRSKTVRPGLGAAIFGSRRSAENFALSLDVGCVVINDVIVPTADPP